VEEISGMKNNQMFEFADVDRDGLIDMLFIADGMNFIVNYNMLPQPLYPFPTDLKDQNSSVISQN
jgi:hypothetical protein